MLSKDLCLSTVQLSSSAVVLFDGAAQEPRAGPECARSCYQPDPESWESFISKCPLDLISCQSTERKLQLAAEKSMKVRKYVFITVKLWWRHFSLLLVSPYYSSCFCCLTVETSVWASQSGDSSTITPLRGTLLHAPSPAERAGRPAAVPINWWWQLCVSAGSPEILGGTSVQVCH